LAAIVRCPSGGRPDHQLACEDRQRPFTNGTDQRNVQLRIACLTHRRGIVLPIFLDRHDLSGLTAADIAEAHRKDLEVQSRYGVKFLTYWFDEARGTGFCLIDAPDIDTAMKVHDEAHGDVAKHVIPVELSAVQAFLGRIADPEPPSPSGTATMDKAFRAIMFTDIVDSTGLTSRLGNELAVEMVRAHDAMVRGALADHNGRVVKHTGDGIMASFEDVSAAVQSSAAIQKAFADFNAVSEQKLQVKIGIDVGEPVADSNDLFGTTVQMAARLCQAADAEGILVSKAVHDGVYSRFSLRGLGSRRFKGFENPVPIYEVHWRSAPGG
jgi:class 3 adenylate cyclase